MRKSNLHIAINMTSVTLNPIVVYFMNTDMKLEHQSFVVVSDELSHSAIIGEDDHKAQRNR